MPQGRVGYDRRPCRAIAPHVSRRVDQIKSRRGLQAPSGPATDRSDLPRVAAPPYTRCCNKPYTRPGTTYGWAYTYGGTSATKN